jgi:hypothetical protein
MQCKSWRNQLHEDSLTRQADSTSAGINIVCSYDTGIITMIIKNK